MKIPIVILAAVSALSAATYQGVISDDMCAADHSKMGVKPDAACVRACVKGHGSKYVLVTNGKVYKLSDQATPEKFAGAKVKVNGTLYEKTGVLKVESIEALK